MRERPIRSGDEPIHARSPLTLRLVLAVLGLIWSIGAAIVFVVVDAPVLAAGFAVVAVIALADSVIVVRHIREGPHYQPGPDVPPYRPVAPFRTPRPPRQRVAPAGRLHRYLALMGLCLLLLVLAWGWVRLFSTGLAVALTLVAMVIPPIAAIMANAGALQDHPPEPDLGRRKPAAQADGQSPDQPPGRSPNWPPSQPDDPG